MKVQSLGTEPSMKLDGLIQRAQTLSRWGLCRLVSPDFAAGIPCMRCIGAMPACCTTTQHDKHHAHLRCSSRPGVQALSLTC